VKRKSTGKRQRFEIFKRDNFTCQYCGRTPPAVVLEIDHITPVSKGGDGHSINLITACFDCNHGKADKLLNQVPKSLSVQIEEMKERKKQVDAYNRFLMKIRQDEEMSITELGYHWNNHFNEEQNKYVFGIARIPTIRTFLKHLPKTEIMDSMDIAFAKFRWQYYERKCWAYFCGVCWRKIKESPKNG